MKPIFEPGDIVSFKLYNWMDKEPNAQDKLHYGMVVGHYTLPKFYDPNNTGEHVVYYRILYKNIIMAQMEKNLTKVC